jgi:hypothetical protein
MRIVESRYQSAKPTPRCCKRKTRTCRCNFQVEFFTVCADQVDEAVLIAVSKNWGIRTVWCLMTEKDTKNIGHCSGLNRGPVITRMLSRTTDVELIPSHVCFFEVYTRNTLHSTKWHLNLRIETYPPGSPGWLSLFSMLGPSFLLNGISFVVRGGGGRRFSCTYLPYSSSYRTVQKLFENSFRRFRSRSHALTHALSSGLTSKNASKKNSPQAAKETAHVVATR